jgi:hypothetical protein
MLEATKLDAIIAAVTLRVCGTWGMGDAGACAQPAWLQAAAESLDADVRLYCTLRSIAITSCASAFARGQLDTSAARQHVVTTRGLGLFRL